MAEPYLIAHLVRGKPAFDVAERMTCPICHRDEERIFECNECGSNGYWWIIPTSGHRAYPYWECSIRKMNWQCKTIWQADEDNTIPPPAPSGWPDHYPALATPTARAAFAEALGLVPKPLLITRR